MTSGSRVINYQSTDPLGRERIRSEVKNGAAPATSTFSYDAIGRLSTAVQVGGAAPFNQQFAYDSLGNVLSLASIGATPGTTSMTYTGTDGDRICSVSYSGTPSSTCNVGYDQLGNITEQPTKTGSRYLSYLAEGNIRTISETSSNATFRYDAFGQVQELDLTSLSSLDVRQDRRYGSMIAIRKEGGNSVITRTIPGPDGFLATRHGGAGAWTLVFGEPRGTRYVVDEHGVFVQDIDYSPFGEAKSSGAQPGSALYTTDQWNGGDALAAFNLSHLGARLYDPVLGRFLSRDPLLIPRTAATTNPYGFALNDPVNMSDPSGLDCEGQECRPGPRERGVDVQLRPGGSPWESVTWPLYVRIHHGEYYPPYSGTGGHQIHLVGDPSPIPPPATDLDRSASLQRVRAFAPGDGTSSSSTSATSVSQVVPDLLVDDGFSPFPGGSYRLGPEALRRLRPIFERFVGSRRFDIGHVRFRFGYAFGRPAYALGDVVTLDKDIWNISSPEERLHRVKHEIAHTAQYYEYSPSPWFVANGIDAWGIASLGVRYSGEFNIENNYNPPQRLMNYSLGEFSPIDLRYTLDQIAERVASEPIGP